MPIFELTTDKLRKIEETSFSIAKVRERADLQRLLRNQIEIISPDTLIIAEEFGEWEDSRRRIDLLGIDKNANLVVFELKRTEDGGHMELQALRYAAMVSTMTFDKAAEVYADYLSKSGNGEDAERTLLDFLEWEDNDDENFAQDVRIVLVSAEFSRELTTSVLWLNDRGLDIRCVRIKPYNDNGRTLIDIEQVIPLPEASEYQVQVSAKSRQERISRTSTKDFTKYDVTIFGKSETRLAKRNAMFFVVKNLCDSGIAPEKINEVINWRRLFLQVDGILNSDDFIRAATVQRESGGKMFEKRRWFCDDGELICIDGKTYALTNQWGNRWGSAIMLLKDTFLKAEIDFHATKESATE
ncbi:MAG: hypothetical protein HFACDABA_02857 [Anaerolineales bacterium]|nr:hypothetical protein [Anaerolineales bacterium]